MVDRWWPAAVAVTGALDARCALASSLPRNEKKVLLRLGVMGGLGEAGTGGCSSCIAGACSYTLRFFSAVKANLYE